MPWSYANIDWDATWAVWRSLDWSATLLAIVAVPLAWFLLSAAGRPGRARAILLHFWMTGGPKDVAIGGFLFAALMIQVVAIHDDDGWFGQSTAAWVQAFGAIGALGVAIFVDQRAAARLRADREAEWAQQRLDRDAALREMNASRVAAVQNLRDVCRSAARHIDAWNGAVDYALPGNVQRAIYAARTVITHRLQRPGEIGGSLISLLSLAEQEAGPLNGHSVFGRVSTEQERNTRAGLYRGTADRLEELLNEYNEGIL